MAAMSRVRVDGGGETDADALWQRISGRIDLRLQLVEQVAVTLLDRALVDDEAQEAAAESAVLAQWLGVLQLSGAATLSRQLSSLLHEDELDAAAGLQIASLVDDLRAVLHAAAVEMSTRSSRSASVRMLGASGVEIDSLMWLLARRGLQVSSHGALDGTLDGVAAVVMMSQPSPTMTYTTLALAKERAPDVERVVIHADEPIDVQCRLARVSDLMVPVSMPPDGIAEEVQRLVLGSSTEPDVVTVLGGARLTETLELYGMTCRSIGTVKEAVDSLDAGSRTLVIGARTPGAMASGLVRLVRARPKLRDVVIAVTAFDDVHDRILRRSGVDIVISSHADPDAWAAHLKALRSRRRRQVDVSMSRDAKVLPWPRASVLLERALVVSRRLDRHAALAVIEVEPGDETEADDAPSDRLIDALATEFRLDDIVGRWDDERIVVLLRGASRRAAVARLAAALKRLELDGRAAAGVAEFPVDGSTLADLLDAGVAAIDRAREACGPRVVSTDWRADSERAVDIVLVEADRSLAGVLESLFERRGHRTHHLTSGKDVLTYLTGSDAAALPKLLILEMDAPGADGLMVLRGLRRSGVMGRLRVLVTCARVRDGELQEAYDLGALDVVEKPYSTVVLTQRVSRLLES